MINVRYDFNTGIDAGLENGIQKGSGNVRTASYRRQGKASVGDLVESVSTQHHKG
jgi:hypothetical protein